MKLKKWLSALLAVVAIVAIGGTVFLVTRSQTPKTVILSDDEFMDALPIKALDGEKEFHQSDIPNIFYTTDPIEFYEYKNGSLQKVSDMVSVPVTMNIFNSKQAIRFELRYVRRGTQVTGFGEYSMDPDKADTVLISDYYFIHAITLPPSAKVNREKNCLLLIDSKKKPVEDPQRVYEETFFFNTESGKAGERYVPDGSRAIDPVTGGKDRNHAMFTTAQVLNATNKRTLYFTGSKYLDKQESDGMEIRSIQGTYTSSVAKGVDYKYARDTANGLLTVRKNKEKTGFNVYWNNQAVLSFSGDFETDYVRDGDFLLPLKDLSSKKNLTLTNMATKETHNIQLNEELSEISALSVSPDGKKLILAGIAAAPASDSSKVQVLLFVNLETGKSQWRAGTALFRNQLPLMCFIDNDTFAYNCTNFDTNKPQLCVARFNDAFKSNTVEVTKGK